MTMQLCLDLLLAVDLWSEDGVLAGHASCECAVEFRSKSQLAHVIRLLAAECVSLLHEALILEAVEPGVP